MLRIVKMVLVQLYLKRAQQYINFPVNLRGRYKIRISGLTYIYSGANNVHEVLELRSSVINFTNSAIDDNISVPNLTKPYPAFYFTNQSVHNVFTTGEAPLIYGEINGSIDLYVGQLSSNVAPTNFLGLILTLDCEEIDVNSGYLSTTKDNYNKY